MYFITSVELCLHLANTVGSKGAAKGRKYSFYLVFMLLLSVKVRRRREVGRGGQGSHFFFLFFFTSTFGIGQRRKETHLNSITGFVLCRGGGHTTPDTRKTTKQNKKKNSPTPTHFNLLFVWFLACWQRLPIWNCIHFFFPLPLLKST